MSEQSQLVSDGLEPLDRRIKLSLSRRQLAQLDLMVQELRMTRGWIIRQALAVGLPVVLDRARQAMRDGYVLTRHGRRAGTSAPHRGPGWTATRSRAGRGRDSRKTSLGGVPRSSFPSTDSAAAALCCRCGFARVFARPARLSGVSLAPSGLLSSASAVASAHAVTLPRRAVSPSPFCAKSVSRPDRPSRELLSGAALRIRTTPLRRGARPR